MVRLECVDVLCGFEWTYAHMSTKLCLVLTGTHVLAFSVAGVEEICCVVELDSPPQQKWMRPVTAGSAGTAAEMEWNEELVL